MKFSSAILFPTAFLLLGIFSSCTGLKCMVCNSAFQKDCGDQEVPEKYLVTCTPSTSSPIAPSMNEHGSSGGVRFSAPRDANFTMCRKTVVTIPNQQNGDNLKLGNTRVIRSCGYADPEKNACRWIAGSGIQTQNCVCDTDACNHASVKYAGPTVVLFLGLSLFARLLNFC